MRNLSTDEVRAIFAAAGCELLGEYKKCGVPVDYRCCCGRVGVITLDKMRRRLTTGGGCKHCGHKEWTEKEDEFLRSHYGKVPRQFLLKLLPGATYHDVKNRAYKLGLSGNKSLVLSQARIGKGRKYEIDFGFFDVVDSLRSYWAGFIAADGNLNESRHRLAIRLAEKDRLHLELFRQTVGYTGPLYEVAAYGKSGPQVLLQCHGVQSWLVRLKENYCLTPRKSLTLQPPVSLDEDNSLAFIIGYIDGDGCISVDVPSVQIVGTNDVLCWIKMWFDRLCPSMNRRYAVVRPNKNVFGYKVAGQRASYILRRLNKIVVPKLERKWRQVL